MIENIVKNNPFAGEFKTEKDLHVFFLDEELPTEKRAMLLSNNSENQQFFTRNRKIYCLLRVSVLDSLIGKDYIGFVIIILIVKFSRRITYENFCN